MGNNLSKHIEKNRRLSKADSKSEADLFLPTTTASLFSGFAIPKTSIRTSSDATNTPVLALSSTYTTNFSTCVGMEIPQ